ncbi:MAG: hypothetical protein SFX19_01530 [Alphaproteobacteria bacterium]|nr:hypothetical protein [Alphaproteobacteria bacterium]
MRQLFLVLLLTFTAATSAQAQTATSACFELKEHDAQQQCLRAAIKQKAENPSPPAQVEKQTKTEPTQKSQPSGKYCCKYCSKGKPCGNSCISARYNCHKPPGCAC